MYGSVRGLRGSTFCLLDRQCIVIIEFKLKMMGENVLRSSFSGAKWDLYQKYADGVDPRTNSAEDLSFIMTTGSISSCLISGFYT